MSDKLTIFRGQKASAPSPNHPSSKDKVAADAKDTDVRITTRAQLLYRMEVDCVHGLRISEWPVTERMKGPSQEWIQQLADGEKHIQHNLQGRSVRLYGVHSPETGGRLDELQDTFETLQTNSHIRTRADLAFHFVKVQRRNYLWQATTYPSAQLVPLEELCIYAIMCMDISDGVQAWYPLVRRRPKVEVARGRGHRLDSIVDT